jgi:hypothetical protein
MIDLGSGSSQPQEDDREAGPAEQPARLPMSLNTWQRSGSPHASGAFRDSGNAITIGFGASVLNRS